MIRIRHIFQGLLAACPLAASEAGGGAPNIIVILTDDQGVGDLSCQWARDMQTPNIDRLFTGGMRMDNFYANSTVSSPSRAGLLTGRYPEMVGVQGVIRTVPTASWGYLSPEAVLLPSVLKQAGYATAHIGKWHLGLESPNLPNERGFDRFHGFLGDMMDDYYTHVRQDHNYMRLNDKQIDPKGHATELFTSWAVDYIRSRAGNKQPFFLYLAYNAPHVPLQPPTQWEERVKAREKGIDPTRAKLVALIEHLDDNVGKVIAALERTGQLENTLIVYASDNGGQESVMADNGPYRGGKGDMYDGGIRVPCAFYWKGTIAPARCERLVMMSDIFPTVCEAASATFTHCIDGVSVLPTLLGKEQQTDGRYVYWMRREHGDLGGKTQNAVIHDGMKLLQNRPFEAMQLFDLSNDPYEKNPLPLKGEAFTSLYKNMMEHYRLTGAVPWQKPQEKTER